MNAHGSDSDYEPRMNTEHSPGSDFPDEARSRKHDALIARLLSDPQKREALSWLRQSGPDDQRTVGGCKANDESIQFIQEIYRLGASEILAVNIHPNPRGGGQYAGKLVVQLPQEPELRMALFEWCKGQGDSLGFTPDPDRGEAYLFLLLD